MTVESKNSKNLYEGNGSATEFTFTFKVYSPDQIRVSVTDTTVYPSTSIYVDIPTSDIVLTENGGTITYLHEQADGSKAPLPVGFVLGIVRNMPFLQQTNILNGQPFNASQMEKDLDIATFERQQLLEAIERTLVTAPSSDVTPEQIIQQVFQVGQDASENAQIATEQADRAQEIATASEQSAQNAKESEEQAKLYAEAAVEITNLKTASETVAGIGKLATIIEAIEGENDTNFMTPKKVREAFPVPLGLLKRMPQIFTGSFSGKNPIGADNVIYTDWQICDGSNGTPDLRNKFVRGGTGSNQGANGGSDTHTHSTTVTIGNTTLSTEQMPTHNHTIEVVEITGHGDYVWGITPSRLSSVGAVQKQGGSQGHNHSAIVSMANSSNLPSFYTLAYIMYIGA